MPLSLTEYQRLLSDVDTRKQIDSALEKRSKALLKIQEGHDDLRNATALLSSLGIQVEATPGTGGARKSSGGSKRATREDYLAALNTIGQMLKKEGKAKDIPPSTIVAMMAQRGFESKQGVEKHMKLPESGFIGHGAARARKYHYDPDSIAVETPKRKRG